MLCTLLLAGALDSDGATAERRQERKHRRGPGKPLPSAHWYSRLAQPYQWRNVAPVNLANSNRLEQLLRAGNMYLSLQDAIALALENNIDIEIQRYGFDLADTDLFRAKATGNYQTAFPRCRPRLTSSIGTTNFLASSGGFTTADARPGFDAC